MTTKTESSAFDEARDLLRRRALRYSKPRALILAHFRERDTHVSAEGIRSALQARGHDVSLSTVYLNLGVLREAHLIREFPGRSGEALYDSNTQPHHHLICRNCGAVLDLPPAELGTEDLPQNLRAHAERVSGWAVETPSLDLMGTCPDCAQGRR